MFHKFHFLSHGGSDQEINQKKVCVFWYACLPQRKMPILPRLSAVKNCKTQQTPLKSFQDPPGRFQVWHIDLSGSLPKSGGCQYRFSYVDRYVRCIEAVEELRCNMHHSFYVYYCLM